MDGNARRLGRCEEVILLRVVDNFLTQITLISRIDADYELHSRMRQVHPSVYKI
jgi:hypothetical protein